MQKIKINPDNTLSITLSDGTSYQVREPLGKDMEGLSQELIKIKHNETVQKLLHRIATPPVTRLQFAKLSLPDIQALGVALDFFSAPPTARAEMLAALADLGYLSESDTPPTTSLA